MEQALALFEDGLDLLRGVDATTLPEGCVTDAVTRLASIDGRIDGIQARLVAAAEAAGVPERSGAGSVTNWLAEATGRSHGHAARTGRLAKAIETTPALGEALAGGDIGPDQAATIASRLDRGTLDPADADDLLESAAHLPPAAFNRDARRLEGRRHQQRLRDNERAAHDARRLGKWRDQDDSLRLEAQFAGTDGDIVDKAIGAFVSPDPVEVPNHLRRTQAQLLADAMIDMCRAVLDTGLAGDVGGVRPHVTLFAPVEAMAALTDAEAAGITATSDLGTTLSAAQFKKLACDATVRRVVLGADSQPVDIGRASRTWPAPIRAAIAAVDGGCRCPFCELPPDRCIVHHVHWWEAGGDTSVDNGAMLANHAHNLIHDLGWTLHMDPETRVCTWTAPDGTTWTTHPYGPAATTAPTRGTEAAVTAAGHARPDDRQLRPIGTATTGPSNNDQPRTRGPTTGTDPPVAQPLSLGL